MMVPKRIENSDGWFRHERRNWIGLVIAAALGGFMLGNGHTTQDSIVGISTEAGCDHYVARKALQAVDQAIASKYNPDIPEPDLSRLPKCK